MSEEKEAPVYIGGMFGKMAREDQPPFVLGTMSIKKADLLAFIEKQDKDDEWMNVDILQRKTDPTKINFVLNKWKPKQQDGSATPPPAASDDENLPF